MAKIAPKGAAIQLSIASVFTTIAQLIEWNGPDPEVQTYNATALDSGVGMEKKPTGWVDGGMLRGSGWMDPVAATFQALTDLIAAPAVSSWKAVWPNVAATEWPFSAILKKISPRVVQTEGLRFDFEAELDGIVAYPT
jgi:hypothetical protein